MKTLIKSGLSLFVAIALVTFTQSCKEQNVEQKNDLAMNTEVETEVVKRPLSDEFKQYWYAGEAEITSYKLEQARYGEIREGNSVLIYVTEPFHNQKQVKADDNNSDNIPVLKLNSTKNYLTGIYPYSIMSSSFYPVHDHSHAIKVSFSSQEWCGQVYAQLNNRADFEIISHSYFESESDSKYNIDKTVLENELWNKIRINPEGLPKGNLKIIPSLEYIRLTHKELKPYDAIVSSIKKDGITSYIIEYKELNRTLAINFTSSFPYSIESWSDSYKDGYGPKAKMLTSTGTKLKTIKSPYWRKNSNKFLPLRDSLGL
ncbi:septum formation inhibitor Maf [Maribacter algarum]|uniref:Septum formation inhibitor Maf n=1 Tax=Maribacter algarum (ex Zhang et al. 2020) TaxID=2578118 RepID=A0A5S3PS06_9FLAO|nr:septum formation inhibitor Maf [Maribacter algarum]TMM57527.1 septum formation inhibitor Maf [Maribacter algarum]